MDLENVEKGPNKSCNFNPFHTTPKDKLQNSSKSARNFNNKAFSSTPKHETQSASELKSLRPTINTNPSKSKSSCSFLRQMRKDHRSSRNNKGFSDEDKKSPAKANPRIVITNEDGDVRKNDETSGTASVNMEVVYSRKYRTSVYCNGGEGMVMMVMKRIMVVSGDDGGSGGDDNDGDNDVGDDGGGDDGGVTWVMVVVMIVMVILLMKVVVVSGHNDDAHDDDDGDDNGGGDGGGGDDGGVTWVMVVVMIVMVILLMKVMVVSGHNNDGAHDDGGETLSLIFRFFHSSRDPSFTICPNHFSYFLKKTGTVL